MSLNEVRVFCSVQVVAGAVIPPGDGGLREGGHTDTVGAQPPVLRAGEEMQPGGDRVPFAGHRVHDKHADDRAQRLAGVPGGRRGRRLSGA